MNILKLSNQNRTISNADISKESLKFAESLCSEASLKFGCCEASSLMLRIRSEESVKGETFDVSIEEGTEVVSLGSFTVYEEELTADKCYKDIEAYNAMYTILNADVIEWYNALKFPMTLKAFRDSFFNHLGIIQEEVVLVNDQMTVEKTIDASAIMGKGIITAICELNGCFGQIGKDNHFHYVFLGAEEKEISNSELILAEYEDFTTAYIDKLQIRQEENDIGVIYGTGTNCYVVQDNFLVYGKSSSELYEVAMNLFGVISNVSYSPCNIQMSANLNLNVGDAIRFPAKGTEIHSYVLERKIKGIQKLEDSIKAKGKQYQGETVKSVNDSIIQLKAKTNVLKRTIEEMSITITDKERGLESKIEQNTKSISSEVTRAKEEENKLSSRIEQTANSFAVEINNIQDQIDGNISTYNLDYVPTLYNYPAWEWTYNIPCNDTVQLRDDLEFEYKDEYYRKHARSVAFDTKTFMTYRFLKQEGADSWYWMEVADSEYSYVLQQISQLRMTDEEIELSVKELEEEIISEYITAKSVESIIAQTAKDIRLEVSKAYETKDSASGNYKSLNSKIELTSEQILQSVSATYETQNNSSSNFKKLESKITQTAESITSEVSKKYETKSNASSNYSSLNSKITQTAESIEAEVKRATSAEGNLSSRITQTAESIESEVKRAQGVENTLSSRITQNANSINLKVSKGSIISEINQTAESVTISAQKIDLNGLVNAPQLTSKFATVETLNAQNARLTNIESNYISADTVKANYMEVANWTSSGKIKADRIDVNEIASRFSTSTKMTAGEMYAVNLSCSALRWKTLLPVGVQNDISFHTESVSINGKSYLLLVGNYV